MTKSLLVIAALTFSNAALACGGKACDHCGEPATASTVDVSKAKGTHLALAVTGMRCGACSTKVTAALEKVDGVNAVKVDHETGKAEIAFDAKKTNAEALISTITALDFKAEVATDEKKKEG